MADKQKILIVDDDNNIAELVSLYLVKECMDTLIVNDGRSAISGFKMYNPDLILLDIMLPGIDGYEVLREIRKSSQVPVIMLSAKGETFDKVLGLELGADDYIIKPFDNKEMVARVKAVLRRYSNSNDTAHNENSETETKMEKVSYPEIEINLSDYSVIYKDSRVDLPPKELELLYYLASNPNRVFSREQLLDRIWGYEYDGDTRTIDVHVKRLREKFDGSDKWRIATVWGIGYKFEVIK